jgi:hypothetical protein
MLHPVAAESALTTTTTLILEKRLFLGGGSLMLRRSRNKGQIGRFLPCQALATTCPGKLAPTGSLILEKTEMNLTCTLWMARYEKLESVERQLYSYLTSFALP